MANYSPLIQSHKRLHSRLAYSAYQATSQIVRRAARDAAQALGPFGDPIDAAASLERHRERFERLMTPHWRRMIQVGTDFESDWLRSQGITGVPRSSPRIEQSTAAKWSRPFLANIRNWVRERASVVWNRLSGWILRRLTRVRGKAIAESRDVLPTMLDSAEAMGFMARLMGLMETTYGLNTGGHYARIELGIGQKVWLSVIDSRTRRPGRYSIFDHVAPHGQFQPAEFPFQVSGERLMFPGDTSLGASASNVCGCRCLSVGLRFRD